jgi:carboxymethylenebutenolidase
MPDITIAAQGGGSFSAYLAMPSKTPAAGLVLIQEIFGVNKVMRDLADNFANQGYIVACPDLFWRIEPGVQLTDKSQGEWDQAFALMNKFLPDFAKGVGDIQSTISHIRGMKECAGKVGTVGYCLGGSLAYATSFFTDSDASVGYYPVQIDDFLGQVPNIKKPLMLHIAEKDGFCPAESQQKIRDALATNKLCTAHTYAGVDHAFARVGGANYNEAAAKQANDRTSAFFKQHLA